MTYKKIIAVLLSAIMLAAIVAGCSDDSGESSDSLTPATEASEASSEAQGEQTSGQPPEASSGSDEQEIDESAQAVKLFFENRYAMFAPDTVMFTVGDSVVTWDLLFFFIHAGMQPLISAFGTVPDLSLELTEGTTYADVILDFAVENAIQFRALEHGLSQLNLYQYSTEVENAQRRVSAMLADAGSEEALIELLWEERGLRDLALLREVLLMESLPISLFQNTFGESGGNLTDEDVSAHFSNNNFMMIKHILLLKTDDNNDALLDEISSVLSLLHEYSGENFEDFFDELMFELSDDHSGLFAFPDGYLFQAGDMEPVFEEAVVLLEVGQLSDVVETELGYHIIFRIPVNYDVIPISAYLMGSSTSLRLSAAMDRFEEMLRDWAQALVPVFTQEFESINLTQPFVPFEVIY